MRLVACPACQTHLDVTGVEAAAVTCPCGATVAAVEQEGLAATVRRCGGCGASLEEHASVCAYCQSPIVREPQRLTLVCPRCLARNPEGGTYCTGCGVEFLPQAPLAGGTPAPCPACAQPLVSQRVRDVWLCACSACDGLWVPSAGFDALVKRLATAAPDASQGLGAGRTRQSGAFDANVVYRRCPDCGQRMNRRNFGRTSGVIVDCCGAHGTWFDADELERVGKFVAAGGLAHADGDAPASDEVRILLAEQTRDEGPWAMLLGKLFQMGR